MLGAIAQLANTAMQNDAVGQGINGMISSGFNKLGDKLGISQLAREQKYARQNMQMQFDFNEKAAENAFERTKEMYERQYQDSTAANKRQQLEDAGLSVGLMYGGGGAGGGGGVPAATPQAQGGMGLLNAHEERTLAQEGAATRLTAAQAKLAEAQADKAKEETQTEKELRKYAVETARQKGITQWIQNKITEYFMDEHEEDEPEEYWWNHRLEEGTWFHPRSVEGQKNFAEALNAWLDAEEKAGAANASNARAALDTERKKYYFMEMIAAMTSANAAKTVALSKKIEALAHQKKIDYETGEEWNWKTIVEYGFRFGEDMIEGAEALSKWGQLKRKLDHEIEMDERTTETWTDENPNPRGGKTTHKVERSRPQK